MGHGLGAASRPTNHGSRVAGRRSVAKAVVLVVLFAFGSAAVARGPGRQAVASSAMGCAATYTAGATCYIADLVPLTASQSYDNAHTHRVCAAAYTSSLALYASYECGTGYAEHCYGGTNELYALGGSGDANTYTGYGVATWNTSCP
jgi:hypothetical protein